MKKFFYTTLPLLASLFLFSNPGARAQVTTTFGYTGAVQTWVVPVGVTSVAVDVRGGSGGLNGQTVLLPFGSMNDSPGHGACVVCTLAVTPGTTLNIYVGGYGDNATTSIAGVGGYNGGGDGGLGYVPYASGGGGGASDIRIGGTALSNRVVVAGGGGGAGGNYFLPAIDFDRGGDGGGTTGEAGSDGGVVGAPGGGGGGTPLGGGGGGSYAGWGTGAAGTVGVGGIAGSPSGGGGGGGGYYGGGGGSWGGGGGGSSYTDPALATAVVHTRGCNLGRYGSVAITVTCVPPTGGAIVGPASFCGGGGTATYTNPTGTAGGTWSSSNPTVATIDPVTGVATGGTAGTTVITYDIILSCGSASVSTTVNVTPAPAPISGGPNPMCASSPTTTSLAFFTDADAGGTWTSGTTTVATIDPVTGMAIASTTAGTTVITYTWAGCTATTTLTVNPLPAPIVGPNQVCRFLTTTLTNATPGGTWSSTVPAAATVSSTGVVTGVGLGATNILYTLPTGCSSDAHFMSVSQPPLPITGPGQVCEASAIVLTELVGGGTWSSSAPSSATVTSGVVTGLAPATVTISYTMPACPPETHVVTVNPLPAIITGSTAICSGYTTVLSSASPGGAWSSSDPAVTVSSTGGVTSTMTGISATIYYTLPTGCFVFTMVNVSVPPDSIMGIDNMCQGDVTTLTATPPIGSGPGIWSSTDLAIAQIIDSSGVLTGISGGTVNISYTLATGCYSVKTFTVNPPVAGSVTLSSSPGGIICEGTPVTFTATPTNGGTATYIWQKFSVPLGGVDSTGTLVDTPIHGDAIMCFMMPHGVCALHDTVGDTIVLNIYPKDVSPSVVISTTGPDTIAYVGQVVTFFSVVTYGGTVQTYQWFRNGVAIPGATNSTYATAVYYTDTFWCEVHGNPPCSAIPVPPGISNQIIVQAVTGVDLVSNGTSDLTLFPNPNNGSFTLSGKVAANSNGDIYFEVTNMLGQSIYTGRTTPVNGKINAPIEIRDIAAGTYLLRVNTEAGSQVFHFVIGR